MWWPREVFSSKKIVEQLLSDLHRVVSASGGHPTDEPGHRGPGQALWPNNSKSPTADGSMRMLILAMPPPRALSLSRSQRHPPWSSGTGSKTISLARVTVAPSWLRAVCMVPQLFRWPSTSLMASPAPLSARLRCEARRPRLCHSTEELQIKFSSPRKGTTARRRGKKFILKCIELSQLQVRKSWSPVRTCTPPSRSAHD